MIAVLRHFLLRLARDRGLPGQASAFFLLSMLVCIFAIGSEEVLIAAVIPGLIWALLLLSSLLGLPDLLEAAELDDLILARKNLGGLMAIKMFAHFIATGLPIVIIAAPALVLLAPGNIVFILEIWAVAALGALSFSALGLLGAALTLNSRRNAALQAIITLPLCVPPLIFGAGTIVSAQLDLGWQAPFAFVAAFACASVTLAPFAAAAIVRMKVSTC